MMVVIKDLESAIVGRAEAESQKQWVRRVSQQVGALMRSVTVVLMVMRAAVEMRMKEKGWQICG